MLIRYNVENFLSYRQNTEFAMIAGKTRTFPEHVIQAKNIELLKAGVIYGANASGKSNLIKSLSFAQDIILSGLKGIDVVNKHFRLSKTCIELPTKFEFEIKCGKKYYAYGFSIILKEKKIIEEWLYEISKTTEKVIFERSEEKNGEHRLELNISFAKSVDKNRFHVYAEDMKTMKQQLFLTEINNKNINQIREITPFIDVFNWFKSTLTVIFPNSRFNGIPFIGSDKQRNEVFCKFLDYFDTGIEAIIPFEIEFEEAFKDSPEELKAKLAKDVNPDEGVLVNTDGLQYALSKNEAGEIKVTKLGLKHKDTNHTSTDEVFEMQDESDGTRRLFDLIPALDNLKKGNKVFFIDELDRSLHPVLTKKFIELFFEVTKNNESQLIVSTHESSILDLKLMRRDEIWFVERNRENESSLYSLDAFQERYDKEIRKGYLLGRYGAIPIFKDLALLEQ